MAYAIFFALFYIIGRGGPLFYVMLTHSIAIWSKNYVVLSVLPALSTTSSGFFYCFLLFVFCFCQKTHIIDGQRSFNIKIYIIPLLGLPANTIPPSVIL